MSYQPGEAVWYETYDEERRLLEHRKPWLPGRVGDILAEAGAILSLLPPPLALAWTGWWIGFRHIRVYPNPVTIHKAAYKGVPIPLFVLACAKWLHGVTVMYKP